LGGSEALGDLPPVFHAQHQRVDLERKRIAVCQFGGTDTQFIGKAPKAGGARIITQLGVLAG
jgi:hypothetical protein